MIFSHISYLYVFFIIAIILVLYIYKYDGVFFKKVKKYWFYKVSKTRRISTFFLALSFFLFALVAGDLRGREQVVEAKIPLQKTVILIDNSASMLVEDIRPNRIRKTVLMARHFIRKSFGHQVSLSVFSDIQKKIVPFTDDIEILESRLETLIETQSQGSSNLILAIREAAQYFKTESGYTNGNILLFTDGEEHSETKLELPPEINLAIVGVGSEKGGKIPLRRKDGSFNKYKKWNSNEVVSKLNKSFFSNLIKNIKYSKVWFAKSYSLPTKEILDFFNKRHKDSFSKGTFKQRPVKGFKIIIAAIMSYVFFVIFLRFPSFIVCILMMLSVSNDVSAGDTESLLEMMKLGKITRSESLRLAENLVQEKKDKEIIRKGVILYESLLTDLYKSDVKDIFNMATGQLKINRKVDALQNYKFLLDKRDITDTLKERIRENIALAFKKKKGKSKGKGKDKKEKNKKEKKEKKDKKSKNGKSKNKGDQEKKNNKKNKKEKEKEKEKKKKKKSDKDKEKKQKAKNKSWNDIKEEIRKKKKKANVKGVLKQIMNDDGNLQRRFLDTSSKNNENNQKDW